MDSLSPLAPFTPSRSSVDCKTEICGAEVGLEQWESGLQLEDPPLSPGSNGTSTRESEEEMEGNANTIYRSFLLWLSYL